MKLKTLARTAFLPALTTLTILAHAGEIPDILWRTNANQYGSFSVVFAPDSKSVFSYGGDAKQWRVSDTNLLRTFTILNKEIGAIALSLDGTRLIGSAPDEFRMWRVSDGAVLFDAASYYSQGLAFSPSGNFIGRGYSDSEGVVLLPVNGESISNGILYDDIISGGVNSLAFSPDGGLLLFGGNGSIAKLMRVSDGIVFQTFPHSLYVKSVAFSPNGRVIATGVHDGDVRLWSTNGTLLHTLAPGGTTRSMDFSPDGRLLATTTGGLLRFWRVSDGALLVTYDPDPIGPVTAVDISPDGMLFAYGGGELVVARMPTVLTKPEKRGNEFNFDWQGGSGLYQVQQTTSVTSAVWANLGPPTTATNLSVPMANPTAFFRVQSLTNAP